MSSREAAAALALVLGLMAGSCGGAPEAGPGRATAPDGSAPPSPTGAAHDDRPTCETGLTAPAGFTRTGGARVREIDHVGVRESYRDEAGRELHVTAGISGEFAEGGVPTEVPLAGGGSGRLLGGGADWVLLWDGPAPCVQRSVGGTGFGRSAFLAALADMGVLAGDRS